LTPCSHKTPFGSTRVEPSAFYPLFFLLPLLSLLLFFLSLLVLPSLSFLLPHPLTHSPHFSLPLTHTSLHPSFTFRIFPLPLSLAQTLSLPLPLKLILLVTYPHTRSTPQPN